MSGYHDIVALHEDAVLSADLAAYLRRCPRLFSRNLVPDFLDDLEAALLGEGTPLVTERDAIPVGAPDDPDRFLLPLLPELRDVLASEDPSNVHRVSVFFQERDLQAFGAELVALARRARADGQALFVDIFP